MGHEAGHGGEGDVALEGAEEEGEVAVNRVGCSVFAQDEGRVIG